MSVSTEELIAINGLLIEREGAYARVGEIEQSINRILGGEYPFDTPEAIPPSAYKRKKVKKTPRAAQKTANAPIKLRRLKAGECAYRLTWSEKGEPQTSEATELRAIEKLIKQPLPGMKLLKVETLDADAAVVESIYDGH